MRTKTAPEELVNQFRGLVWSCHSLIDEHRRPLHERQVLVQQMQQFKNGERLLCTHLLSNLLEITGRLLLLLWETVRDTPNLSKKGAGEKALIVRLADEIYLELDRIIKILESSPPTQFPFATTSFGEKIRWFENHPSAFKLLEERGVVDQLLRLQEVLKK